MDHDKFAIGYNVAMIEDECTAEEPEFNNPFIEGTDEWKGYEEAVYDLTQK